MSEPRGPGSGSLWPAALLMSAVVAVLIVVFVAVYPDDGTDRDRGRTTTSGPPPIIEKPDVGRAPEQPGDPGGWQQLALFGVVMAGLATVVVLVWRSSRKARSPGA